MKFHCVVESYSGTNLSDFGADLIQDQDSGLVNPDADYADTAAVFSCIEYVVFARRQHHSRLFKR